MIHDVFVQGLMPVRVLPEVSRQYFAVGRQFGMTETPKKASNALVTVA